MEEQKKIQALVLDKKDNVATSIVEIRAQDTALIQFPDGSKTEVVVDAYIPKYHKLALRNILADELVKKYGYPIGRSIKEIKKGEHVHTHNITSEQEAK